MIAHINPDTHHRREPAAQSAQRKKLPRRSTEGSKSAKSPFRPCLSSLCFFGAIPAFVALLLSLVLLGCSGKEKDKDKDEAKSPTAEKEKSGEPESRVKHGTNGEAIITLDTATQKLMGLQVSSVQAAQLSPELKGYGRVLDPAPLASLVADLVTAQAASAASRAELERLKTLAAQNNASERALQAAQATAAHDQSQLESVHLRLVSGWGKAISEHPDLPVFVNSLSSLTSVLVQLDLPAGQPVESMPTGARLLTLADESKTLPAEFLEPAPSVDPQMQGRGYLFLVQTNAFHLAPGAAVAGFLLLPGEPQSGVNVPRNAVVRFNGASWVYLVKSDQEFERREIQLEAPLGDSWFVRKGVKSEDKVVTVGAQELLSEELKGQAGD